MDFIPETPYLQVHPDTLQMVRKEINMDKPGEMKEAVRILDEWVKQQPHFIEKNIPLRYLEMTIVQSKGSVERAKRLIENTYTARTLRPQYFEPRAFREYYEVFKNNYSVVAMPKLTPDNHRIYIVKIRGKIQNHMFEAVSKYNFSTMDYVKLHDYHSGIISIYDVSEADLQHLVTNTNFMEIKQYMVTMLTAYGLRVKRSHVITQSKIIHTVLSIVSPFLSKKIVDRQVVNANAEELLQYYSKDLLPKDFGGDCKSISELQEEIVTNLSSNEHLEHMKLMSGCKIDKSKCPSHLLSIEGGIQGTFRSLSID